MDKRTANGSPPHKGSLPAIDKDGDFRSEEVVPFFSLDRSKCCLLIFFRWMCGVSMIVYSCNYVSLISRVCALVRGFVHRTKWPNVASDMHTVQDFTVHTPERQIFIFPMPRTRPSVPKPWPTWPGNLKRPTPTPNPEPDPRVLWRCATIRRPEKLSPHFEDTFGSSEGEGVLLKISPFWRLIWLI